MSNAIESRLAVPRFDGGAVMVRGSITVARMRPEYTATTVWRIHEDDKND